MPPTDAPALRPVDVPRLDAQGRYHARGTVSAITLGIYVLVILLLIFVVARDAADNVYAVYVLTLVTVFFAFRYALTNYRIDDTYLYARRVLGSRRVPLADIRKIEFMRLRDLSATGFFGSWGYRGRMWSPFIGKLDAIYTDPSGLLITGGDVPLFISPRDSPGFARELSRRVRSSSGALTVDVGSP
jgi:hypothetical protein